MVELGEDANRCEKNLKCFTMDEAFLNDLLECSVCLEQLDSSSKVLPCQHTFCKRCLQEIVNSHKELRCPECRILVETKIEDLPCNILLVRLLEGIKNNVRPKRVSSSAGDGAVRGPESSTGQIRQTPPHPQLPQPPGSLPCMLSSGDLRTVPKQVLQPCPCAKALYPYEAKVPGDLTFKKGDVIMLRKRIDQNWFYGELGGKSGFVPASFVQVVVPIPTHVPQCKALYDFQISNSEEKDCLTFAKGDILTVIRRIDDHWAEGKLRERIGIFPISFVEMNAAARAVMKLSSNTLQGPSRILPPPAPSTESHFIAIQPATTASASTTQPAMCQESLSCISTAQTIPAALSPPFSSSAFSSPTHTNPITPLHITPNQIAQPQSSNVAMFPSTSHESQQAGPQPFTLGPSHHRQTLPLIQQVLQSSTNSQDSDEQASGNGDCVHESSVVVRSRSTPSPGPVFAQTSVAAVTPPVVSQRAESMACAQTSQQGSHVETVGITAPHLSASDMPSLCHTPARSISSSHPPTHVPVPTFYLALYTYRPQKEDELELRKGELYTVSEKCQDGWFKGTSLRTGLSGVFPGNYVQLAKSAVLHTHIVTSPAGQTSPSTSPPPTSSVSNQPRIVTVANEPSQYQSNPQGIIYTNSPTSLGGRTLTTSPSPISLSHPAVSEWAHSVAAIAAPLQRLSRPINSAVVLSPGLYKAEGMSKQNGIPVSQARSPSITPWTSNCTVDFTSVPSASPLITEFPVRTTSGSPTRMLPYQASSSVSIGSLQIVSQGMMPGNSTDGTGQPRYSISQPSTPLMMPHTLSATTCTNPFITSATDRISSSPLSVAAMAVPCSSAASITSQSRMDKHKEKKEKEIVSLMKRLTKRKSKSPPPSDYSCDNPTFVDATASVGQSLATVHVRSTSCPSEALGSQNVNHKKTGSLDGCGNSEISRSSSRPKIPVPLVRERFRCIVPYPPNSDYELELKVGDIVYVHKKREDGWYKGTLQRTGKIGLFPSSFVERFWHE